MFFYWIIPIIPFILAFDGLISILRTRTEQEMRELIVSLKNFESFDWEIGRPKLLVVPINYVIGIPKANRKKDK
jgi:hypothetical protein